MSNNKKSKSRIAPKGRNTLALPPPNIHFREKSDPAGNDEPIVGKWIYVFIEPTKELYAEVYAEKADSWHVEYRPLKKRKKKLTSFDSRTKGYVVINRKRLKNGEYRVFLSPVRASDDALDQLKDQLKELEVVLPLGVNSAGIQWANVLDAFHAAEIQHKKYLAEFDKWDGFVNDQKRQGRLFIATTIASWLAGGDKADVADRLKSKSGPANVVKRYEKDEKKKRGASEWAMVAGIHIMDSVRHALIDLSTQQQGKDELAVGLLHWGIVSQSMLCVAPGRVFANKLMQENKALPAAILMGDADHPDLYGAYATFKKAYAAAMTTYLELLAARVRQLKGSVKARDINQKIILYLRKLGIESELRGTYKRIHERLEAGDKITKRLKGTKRSSVIKSYKKLQRKAGVAIPDYGKDAKVVLGTADRLDAKHLSHENVVQVAQILFDAISLMDSIVDYRDSFPQDKDKKLIAIVGAGGDFYGAAADLAEKMNKGLKFLRITGGAASLISGIVDMLDAEDKAVRAAMNDKNYAAAAGHGITAVGASMTAIAGGILLVKGISGGAMFGGPFGAIVGAIGAGLMAIGMLVVAYFSDNDYQQFAEHCYLGKDSSTSITPDWSTVGFGGGSIMNEVYALYDLLYRYKVNFVKVAKIHAGIPYSTTSWAGVKLIIYPQYGFGSESKYHIDVKMVHDSRAIESTFEVKGLVLPDSKSSTGSGKIPYIVRRWTAGEAVDNMLAQKKKPTARKGVPESLHRYTGHFTLTCQLMLGQMAVGKVFRLKGKIGGHNPKPISTKWTQRDYEEHHIEFE